MKPKFYHIAIIFFLIAGSVAAQDIGVKVNTVFAPASIPFDSAGNPPTDVLMLMVTVEERTGPPSTLDGVTVQLDGTVADSDITQVAIYFEPQGGDKIFDPVADGPALVTGTFTAGVANLVFAPVTVNPSAGADRDQIYVVYNFVDIGTNSTIHQETAGATVTTLSSSTGTLLTGGGMTAPPWPATPAPSNLDRYETTLTASTGALTPPLTTAFPGDEVTALQLDFDVPEDSGNPDTTLLAGGHVTIDSMGFYLTGTGVDGDVAAGGVRVFDDIDADTVYTFGVDTELGTGSVASGFADVTLTTPIALSTGNVTYFVSVTVSATATEGNTIGLEVQNPNLPANVGFADGITDLGVVTGYNQTGYIVSAATTPAASAEFVIQAIPDLTDPSVSTTVPINSAVGILRNTVIQAVFSEDMDEATVIGANFSLVGNSVGPVSGIFGYNDGTNTITFTPDSLLDFAELYTATISGGVTDEAANPLSGTYGGDYVWSFSTEAAIPPSVLSVTPADGAGDVSVNTEIIAVFSEAMDDLTMVDANFTVLDSDGVVIGGASSYDSGTYTIVITPTLALDYSTTYSASVSSAVMDLGGTAMLADYSWSFTTENEYPEFQESTVINNRIEPGSTDPVLIFIPEPPGGPEDTISVQIFTATGKRVISLVSNEPYQDIIADLPLVWDGTNERQQRLGPGLYFIQIRGTGYEKVLEVLIVR